MDRGKAFFTSTDEDGEQVLEWWHGTRKLTMYKSVTLKVWGANIETEMEELPTNDAEAVAKAFAWLTEKEVKNG
jgi:hypothetical protein